MPESWHGGMAATENVVLRVGEKVPCRRRENRCRARDIYADSLAGCPTGEKSGHPAHGGRLVFVGLFQGDMTFNDPNFHRRELTLLATRNALPENFTRIIQLIEAGRINTAPWITHRAQFAEAVTKFPSWTRPETGVIKAMIEV